MTLIKTSVNSLLSEATSEATGGGVNITFGNGKRDFALFEIS